MSVISVVPIVAGPIAVPIPIAGPSIVRSGKILSPTPIPGPVAAVDIASPIRAERPAAPAAHAGAEAAAASAATAEAAASSSSTAATSTASSSAAAAARSRQRAGKRGCQREPNRDCCKDA
jgi:hypothetical protein